MLPAESENDALTDGRTDRQTDGQTGGWILEHNFLNGYPALFKVVGYKKSVIYQRLESARKLRAS